MVQFIIFYYIVVFVVFMRGHIETKKDFLKVITPLGAIIYPLEWVWNYYKSLK